MAEVRKNKKVVKYDISEMLEAKSDKGKNKKDKNKEKDTKSKSSKSETKNKQSLWVRFRIFCHGVASEFKKVHWPTKYNMVKYSIATIVFVIFLAILFYIIDILFALVQTLI